jgi:hypothetical protein
MSNPPCRMTARAESLNPEKSLANKTRRTATQRWRRFKKNGF